MGSWVSGCWVDVIISEKRKAVLQTREKIKPGTPFLQLSFHCIRYNFEFLKFVVMQVFYPLGSLTFLGWIILCCGAPCIKKCWVAPSSLPARCHTPKVVTIKWISRHCQIWEKNKHLFRTTVAMEMVEGAKFCVGWLCWFCHMPSCPGWTAFPFLYVSWMREGHQIFVGDLEGTREAATHTLVWPTHILVDLLSHPIRVKQLLYLFDQHLQLWVC